MIFRLHGLHPVAAFRVDASREIGMGHLERCLTMARAMKILGIDVHFISTDYGIQYYKKVYDESFKLTLLRAGLNDFGEDKVEKDANQSIEILKKNPAQIAVVDHYGLGKSWEDRVKNNVSYLMVIDDLKNREHSCNALIDQNVGRKVRDYEKLVNREAILLIGPKYALLRNEFICQRRKFSKLAEAVNKPSSKSELKILISMGGVDSSNVTGRVVEILSKMTFDKAVSFSILIGQNFPHEMDIVSKLKNFPHKCSIQKEVRKLANFVQEHSIAIGGAGISALERCSLGIPSILIVLAENQAPGAIAMEKIGAAISLCQLKNLEGDLPPAILKILDIDNRESIRAKSMSIVDCRGVNRIMDLFWTDIPGALIVKQLKVDDVDMMY